MFGLNSITDRFMIWCIDAGHAAFQEGAAENLQMQILIAPSGKVNCPQG
jgi:hypothetical protein